jgi:hypothetical protein
MPGKVDSNTHAAAIARIGEAAKHETELRTHLEEVISGAAFKGSHRSQAFLTHIVEQALRGDPADLRERSIGVALFGRPVTYDTAEDAIVRVTASDVRKRLLQHYGNAGGQSKFRITLPSGSYIPEFSLLPDPPAAAPTPPPVDPSPAPPSPPTARSGILRSRQGIAALLLVAAVLSIWWLGTRKAATRDRAESLVMAAFRGTPQQAQVVVADDALVLIQVLLNRRFSLKEYENLTYLNPPDLVQKKELQWFWASLSTRQITNVGDLQNAHRIADILQARGFEATIRHARQMHARAYRSGNYIILGSSLSNPWADLFQVENSNFPFDELPRPGLPEVILNRSPQGSEPAKFEVYADPKTRKLTTYARVSLVDNTGRTGRVLLVAGQSMSATEMAAEMMLRDDSAALFRRSLRLAAGSAIPPFEAVVRISEQNEIGDSVDLVACRKVGDRSY